MTPCAITKSTAVTDASGRFTLSFNKLVTGGAFYPPYVFMPTTAGRSFFSGTYKPVLGKYWSLTARFGGY